LTDALCCCTAAAAEYNIRADFGDLIEPLKHISNDIYIITYHICRKTYSQIKLLNRLRRASGVYYDLCVPIKVVVARAHARPPLRLQRHGVIPDRHLTLSYYIYICNTSWARYYYYYYYISIRLLLSTHTHTYIYNVYVYIIYGRVLHARRGQ